LVTRRPAAGLWEPFRVLPGARRSVMVDISRWFDLSEPGSYLVSALVTIAGQSFVSAPARCVVDNGLPLDRVTQGLAGSSAPPRTYSLRYLARAGSERLFLRVDEEDQSVNYGTFELGPLIRSVSPRLTVTLDGTVTVVHESGFNTFTRSTLRSELDGVRFLDQRYERADGAPLPRSAKGGGGAPTEGKEPVDLRGER
jgi:hypothetical protein